MHVFLSTCGNTDEWSSIVAYSDKMLSFIEDLHGSRLEHEYALWRHWHFTGSSFLLMFPVKITRTMHSCVVGIGVAPECSAMMSLLSLNSGVPLSMKMIPSQKFWSTLAIATSVHQYFWVFLEAHNFKSLQHISTLILLILFWWCISYLNFKGLMDDW